MNKPFVNIFDLDTSFFQEKTSPQVLTVLKEVYAQDQSLEISELLTKGEVQQMLKILDQIVWQPVGVTGILEEYSKTQQIGSYRASCFSEHLAEIIWQRISNYIDMEVGRTNSTTDCSEGERWKPIGINPLFRFIRYKKQGLLVPHYDASYIYNQRKRTMKSMVIYLEGNGQEGATRFIHDPQYQQDFNKRDYSDWVRGAEEQEILTSFYPSAGKALLFNHRILHDSQPITNQQKTIIRTDIVYEKVV